MDGRMIERVSLPDVASYTASAGVGVYGLVTAQWVGVVVGILCALITAGVSIWVKLRDDRRKAELHAAQMRALERR